MRILGLLADYVHEKIEVSSISPKQYVSTDSMLPNRQGIIESVSFPKAGKVSEFQRGDVLVSNIRPYFKKIWKATFSGGCSNDVLVFRSRDSNVLDNGFLFYALSQDEFFKHMMAGANGTKMPRGNKELIPYFELPDYDVTKQKKIASILMTYDNLIENNRKQIALLEEAAQRLYKEWFVDLRFPGHDYAKTNGGIPSGWKRMKLGEYAPFKRGKVITAKQTKPGSIPVVAGGLEPAYYHAEANTSGPVVTVSGSGANAGFTRLYTCNVWASDCSYADMNTNENILFVYLSVKLLGRGFRHLQRGSAQPHVYPTHINDLDLLVPPRELLDKFNCIVTKQYKAMRVAKQSIEAAREARDRLLPKLMSGEIEVKE